MFGLTLFPSGFQRHKCLSSWGWAIPVLSSSSAPLMCSLWGGVGLEWQLCVGERADLSSRHKICLLYLSSVPFTFSPICLPDSQQLTGNYWSVLLRTWKIFNLETEIQHTAVCALFPCILLCSELFPPQWLSRLPSLDFAWSLSIPSSLCIKLLVLSFVFLSSQCSCVPSVLLFISDII